MQMLMWSEKSFKAFVEAVLVHTIHTASADTCTNVDANDADNSRHGVQRCVDARSLFHAVTIDVLASGSTTFWSAHTRRAPRGGPSCPYSNLATDPQLRAAAFGRLPDWRKHGSTEAAADQKVTDLEKDPAQRWTPACKRRKMEGWYDVPMSSKAEESDPYMAPKDVRMLILMVMVFRQFVVVFCGASWHSTGLLRMYCSCMRLAVL